MSQIELYKADKFAILQKDAADIPALIKENLGPAGITEFDLDRVGMPSGGGLAWEVPSLAGPQAEKELVGVVVAVGDRRAYWETSFDEQPGKPPDCSSMDGIRGHGTIALKHGPNCAACPMAVFGSAKPKPAAQGQPARASRGQACNQRKVLFLYREGDRLPLVINLAPTSLDAWKKYALRLSSLGLPYYGVLTALQLKQDQNADGVKYSMVSPQLRGQLDPETKAKFRDIAAALAPVFSRVQVEMRDPAGA